MKKGNEYHRLIDPKLYERMPKTVLASIVVSLLAMRSDSAEELLNENPSKISFDILDEWKALHDAGIVPQKPPMGKI